MHIYEGAETSHSGKGRVNIWYTSAPMSGAGIPSEHLVLQLLGSRPRLRSDWERSFAAQHASTHPNSLSDARKGIFSRGGSATTARLAPAPRFCPMIAAGTVPLDKLSCGIVRLVYPVNVYTTASLVI
ncbi:hypothetical protein P280DRAFT_67979 [Massarina eburnea CBS 473.64]|uniref:Uncharacterized protein n=1 Tax=Massarina eburnea CBS 473.64 TaxID=1395130 RepID=A0A6A6RV02_9PLEO|nr:hypothetical protein P280DRAFT_67979 [Massarina eburnea CBS 473.64]